jgi:hypothetical protein
LKWRREAGLIELIALWSDSLRVAVWQGLDGGERRHDGEHQQSGEPRSPSVHNYLFFLVMDCKLQA